MTARIAVAIASCIVALTTSGCLKFYDVPVEVPVQAKIDVTKFQRVLVAGFLSGGARTIDPNTETARLLRSQLRNKQELRVIDADVLSLVDEVDRRRGAARATSPAEPKIQNDADLKEYEAIFADEEYWQRVAAEFDGPLIVTGSILFTEVAKSGMVTRPQPFVDPQSGQESYRSVMEYSDMKGYALTPKFVFIDGKTGKELYSETYREEALYAAGQNTPALSSYFEMMDKVLPMFLNTLSSQKIKGNRTLLK
jgi:hypothetical protein